MKSKIREDFEVWAESECLNLAVCHGPQDEAAYVMAETNFTWRAWQASRASLVIELPRAREECTHFCEPGVDNIYSAAIRDINAAGLKVKS